MVVTYTTTGEHLYFYSNNRLKARSFFDRQLPGTFFILPWREGCPEGKSGNIRCFFDSGMRLASRPPAHLPAGKPTMGLSIVANGRSEQNLP